MKYIVILISCLLIICSGCGKSTATIAKEEYVGKIIDANVIPNNINNNPKMCIKTEKMVVIISCLTYVNIGQEAKIVHLSDGRVMFTWDDSPYSYYIY